MQSRISGWCSRLTGQGAPPETARTSAVSGEGTLASRAPQSTRRQRTRHGPGDPRTPSSPGWSVAVTREQPPRRRGRPGPCPAKSGREAPHLSRAKDRGAATMRPRTRAGSGFRCSAVPGPTSTPRLRSGTHAQPARERRSAHTDALRSDASVCAHAFHTLAPCTPRAPNRVVVVPVLPVATRPPSRTTVSRIFLPGHTPRPLDAAARLRELSVQLCFTSAPLPSSRPPALALAPRDQVNPLCDRESWSTAATLQGVSGLGRWSHVRRSGWRGACAPQ
jgi:hypothetical protein